MNKVSYVYMLLCKDGTYYTGYCVDVARRLSEHNAGKGAKYTRARRPCALVYVEECENRSEALRREAQIKTYARARKEMLTKQYLANKAGANMTL